MRVRKVQGLLALLVLGTFACEAQPELITAEAPLTSENEVLSSESELGQTEEALFWCPPGGVPGPTGPRGPTGPAGPRGATGPAGPAGAQGPAGAAGADGPAGPAGPQGDVGPMGPQGAPGAPGAPGAQGAQGAQGPQGAQGEQGPAGPQGPQGVQGQTGATGPQGEQGPQGLQGEQGPQGDQGPPGLPGQQGLQGPTGPQGDPGEQGEPGEQGPPGLIALYHNAVETDIGMSGQLISGSFQPTPGTPGTLSVTAPEAGTYLLTWYTEVMRTVNLGSAPFSVRLRDVTANSTRGFMRDGSGVDNGSTAGMPQDTDFFLPGDILPFSGSAVVYLSGAPQTYRLEYAMSSTSTTTSDMLRARRQRITLMRVE